MRSFDAEQFRRELKDLPKYLFTFLAHPLEGIRSTPLLSWPALFSLQLGGAMIAGALVGLTSASFIDFLLGIFVYPISSLILAFVFALFIYYFFSLFQATFLEFRRLYGIVVLAHLPYFVFHAAAGFLPPIDLLGFAFTAALLIVGLTEQFGLDRRLVTRLVGGLYLVFFVVWAISLVKSSGL